MYKKISIFIIILFVLILSSSFYLFVWNKGDKTNKKEMQVLVYFGNSKLDPALSCDKVFPTERNISYDVSVIRATLEELLKGTNEIDKGDGYFTSINPGVKIQKLVIKDKTAFVDFDETLDKGVAGSCKVSMIRAEISETLKQFEGVEKIVISIDGRIGDILQP